MLLPASQPPVRCSPQDSRDWLTAQGGPFASWAWTKATGRAVFLLVFLPLSAGPSLLFHFRVASEPKPRGSEVPRPGIRGMAKPPPRPRKARLKERTRRRRGVQEIDPAPSAQSQDCSDSWWSSLLPAQRQPPFTSSATPSPFSLHNLASSGMNKITWGRIKY